MTEEIRVLVVDDSAVMRRAISHIFESTEGIKVIGYGRSGKDAIEKVKSLQPDIVTMDIEMPVMDGLTALRHIMQNTPLPVVMVSSLTTEGAQATIDALNAGAVDFVPKNFAAIVQHDEDFIRIFTEKIKYLARRTRKTPAPSNLHEQVVQSFQTKEQRTGIPPKRHTQKGKYDLVLIGSSTGGPKILHQIIPQLPADFPAAILIVQHMPAFFTKSLADRLNNLSKLRVKEAVNDELVVAGHVYIAPGGHQMLPESKSDGLHLRILDAGDDIIYKPSVDLAAQSVARSYKKHTLAIMLTGMGKDGLRGFEELKEKGAYIIAQSMESAIIYGMPKAIVDAGIEDEILHTEQIAPRMVRLCQQNAVVPSTSY